MIKSNLKWSNRSIWLAVSILALVIVVSFQNCSRNRFGKNQNPNQTGSVKDGIDQSRTAENDANAALSQKGCYLSNIDLNCKSLKSPWTRQSPITRKLLRDSPEVQNNFSSCQTFTKLIKSECQISDTVQTVFTDGSKNGQITNFQVEGDDKLFETRDKLPKAFQDYFNDNGLLQAQVQSYLVLQKLGSPKAIVLNNFLNSKNKNDTLKIPMACNADGNDGSLIVQDQCGYSVHCRTITNGNVGEYIQITKTGSAGARALPCSQAQLLKYVLGRIASVSLQTPHQDSLKYVTTAEQTTTTNYAGFGSMPLLSQTDGWLQGLFIDKYGEENNYAKSGVCLATSMTMLAIALKKESPNSHLGNGFDKIPLPADNIWGDGATLVPDPAKKGEFKSLKYSHYAVYIDEMMRMAGLLDGIFPNQIVHYQKLFHKKSYWVTANTDYEKSYVDPVSTPQDFSTDLKQEEADYQNYVKNKPTQDYVEQNYVRWIKGKTGVVLALQSEGIIKAATQNEGRIGHANVIATISGSTSSGYVINLMDPWGVVNQVKFVDRAMSFNVSDQDHKDCVDKLGDDSICYKKGTVNRLSNWKMHFLSHIGSDVGGYIGQKYLNHSSYMGAYITGYFLADPWPASVTYDQFRVSHLTTNRLSQTNSTGQSCTADTRGSITVGNKKYTFINPMPFVSTTSAIGGNGASGASVPKYSSTVPVTAGCMNFFDDTGRHSLVGTFKFTCNNGQISITQNNCAEIQTESCDIPYGVGVRVPVSGYPRLGSQAYYSANGKCKIVSCNSGFSENKDGTSCDCTFVEQVSQKSLPGTISAQKTCSFVKNNCPINTIYSPASWPKYPFCYEKDQVFSTAGSELQKYLFSRVKDATGRSLAAQSAYANFKLDENGYLKFINCISSEYVEEKNSDGLVNCKPKNLSSTITNGSAADWVTVTKKISTGKKEDGSCVTGFLKDHENKFCVASLTSCNYGPGAMGLRTFDPSARRSCRFMGCLENYKVLKYTTRYESQSASGDLNSFYCAKDSSYKVSVDGFSVQKTVEGLGLVTIAGDIVPAVSEIKDRQILTTDQEIINAMNGTTDLDCSLVPEADLSICQALASLNFKSGYYLKDRPYCRVADNLKNMALCAPAGLDYGYLNKIDSQKISQVIAKATTNPKKVSALGTFNCGGPDSMALDGYINNSVGSCMQHWSKKVSIFGQCFVPNGKGVITPGKGCMVESCQSGFVANPTRRACLRLGMPCYRSDLEPNTYEAYPADVNLDGNFEGTSVTNNFNNKGGIGRFSACLILSCKNGYQHADILAPVIAGYSGNGILVDSDPNNSQSMGTEKKPLYNNYRPPENHYSDTYKGVVLENEAPQYTDFCLDANTYAKQFLLDQSKISSSLRPQNLPGQWCLFAFGTSEITAQEIINQKLTKCKTTQVSGLKYGLSPAVTVKDCESSVNLTSQTKASLIPFAEGVYGYDTTAVSSLNPSGLVCKFKACRKSDYTNIGTITDPICSRMTGASLQDSCDNQVCLTKTMTEKLINSCLNVSTNILAADRKTCMMAPVNLWYGFDESLINTNANYRSNMSKPNRDYLMDRPTIAAKPAGVLFAPSSFVRYLPRWSGNGVIDYLDIKTMNILPSTMPFNQSAQEGSIVQFAPKITLTLPKNNEGEISPSTQIILFFNKKIISFSNPPAIGVYSVAEDKFVNSTLKIIDNRIEIVPSRLVSNTEYYVKVERGYIKDELGQAFSGLTGGGSMGKQDYKFKTGNSSGSGLKTYKYEQN